MQRPPLLVFAQSGRFIAESAARAGYQVRVADCFADSDTLAVADVSIQLPPLSELSEAQLLQTLISLSRDQPCLLLCGTGIERFYPSLSQLPPHIEVIGNSQQTLALLRQPEGFFALLAHLKLPYPATSLTAPAPEKPLRKRLDCAGGAAVYADSEALQDGEFYQQEISGEARSVCFIADGQNVIILGWNRQLNQPGKFTLEKIWQTDKPPANHAMQLTAILDKLVKASGIKGFNSLDYMLSSQDEIDILELNPRISASVELLHEADWLSWHIQTCRGLPLPDTAKRSQTPAVRLLKYFYAEKDWKVVDEPLWPLQCHDHPVAGSKIKKGQPVCTFILAAESEQACDEQLASCEQKLLNNCLKPT
jgi:predicted ATP-grasp superfamily ATP-dependent carboligase